MSIAEKIYTRSGRNITVESGRVAYNLGCGDQKFSGVVGVDSIPRKGVDVIHNLDVFPWPIPDNSTDTIFLFQTLEHLDNVVRVMEEIWRISKNGGRVIIEVPYFRHQGAFQDPTHKHFFTSATMLYFCKTQKREKGPYSDGVFRQVDFWFGWPARSRNPLMVLFKGFAKKYPNFYDGVLSKFFPAKIIVYELEAIKP